MVLWGVVSLPSQLEYRAAGTALGKEGTNNGFCELEKLRLPSWLGGISISPEQHIIQTTDGFLWNVEITKGGNETQL